MMGVRCSPWALVRRPPLNGSSAGVESDVPTSGLVSKPTLASAETSDGKNIWIAGSVGSGHVTGLRSQPIDACWLLTAPCI